MNELFNLDFNNKLSKRWLLIGVLSLAIAGLFSLVLVVARTPSLATIPLFNNLFHSALVVHVDLSVLVWFLSIACMFWSLSANRNRSIIPYIEEAAQICFVSGMFFIAASPFDGSAEALMSNYIPVITSPLFFFGLSQLLCGVGLMLARLLLTSNAIRATNYAILTSAVITVISIIAFVWSFQIMPPQIEGQQVYELGFWAGGHILQFTHTQILLICWLLLVKTVAVSSLRGGVADKAIHSTQAGLFHFVRNDKLLFVLFSIGLVAALASPLAYILYDITSMEYREFFTNLMIMAGGIAPSILALIIIPKLWKTRTQKSAIWISLFMSLLLFMYGGFLAGLIRGQNVVIPAHYHGSIVGITLAFMGIVYLFLPKFNYKDVSNWKLAFWQPIIYGGGQILHISGLAWSGGYGVLRKTPGVANEISLNIKIAMGFMGLGGLLAIIGGLMFIVVVIKAVRK